MGGTRARVLGAFDRIVGGQGETQMRTAPVAGRALIRLIQFRRVVNQQIGDVIRQCCHFGAAGTVKLERLVDRSCWTGRNWSIIICNERQSCKPRTSPVVAEINKVLVQGQADQAQVGVLDDCA